MNLFPTLPEKYRSLSSSELKTLRRERWQAMSSKERWQSNLIQFLPGLLVLILGFACFGLYRDVFRGRHFFLPMGLVFVAQGVTNYLCMRWSSVRLLSKGLGSAGGDEA